MKTNQKPLMKRRPGLALALTLRLAVTILMSAASLNLAVAKDDEQAQPQLDGVRTTAYTHTEADHTQYGRKTAIGTTLKSGSVNSAAADWSFMPVGTKFRIRGDDTVYEVEDYGSALVGTETVDIYRPSRGSMNSWGTRHVDIEIIKVGCVETSIALLKQRTKYSHCRAMLASLLKEAPKIEQMAKEQEKKEKRRFIFGRRTVS